MPRAFLSCLALLALIGCTSIGPPTLRRDRLDYADALAEAAKRETLLNVVKLRYADTPSLVTVSQLVAGYSLEGRIDLGSNFFTNTFDFSDDLALGVGGTFSDRPTVTYTPVASRQCAENCETSDNLCSKEVPNLVGGKAGHIQNVLRILSYGMRCL